MWGLVLVGIVMAYPTNKTTGSLVTTFYDNINNRRLTQFDYDCVRGTDYMINKNIPEAIKYANSVAAEVVTKKGVSTI
jgi:sugar/nucleoside kinase (ribokinase family)